MTNIQNILRCYATGMGIKSIADAFDISRNTVRKYVRLYQQSGLVQPSAIACRPYKDSRPDSWAAISVMVSSDREADHGTFQLVCSEAMRRIGR